jgi:threonine/homoserine/homoserine lactone efflux protein
MYHSLSARDLPLIISGTVLPLLYLLEGIIVGFVGAMPIGPIGILCIRRSLTLGRKQGIVTGLGGATADIVYVTIALFGIKLIADFVALEQYSIRLCGGLGVLAIGIFVLRSHPTSRLIASSKFEHTRLYVSTFLLALSNPVPLLGFAAMLSAIGIKHIAGEMFERIFFVAGVFVGSLVWFSLLANVANAVRRTMSDQTLSRINKIAGMILIVLGVVAVGSSLSGL